MKHLSLLLLVLLSLSSPLHAQEYNILEYGAVPDGQTLNTQAIQSAIDAAHAAGGGQVIVPKGRFLSGSIVLKSGVDLHLEKKAVLLGSARLADYQRLNRWKALVLADSADNISITGKGTLDGQGARLGIAIDSLFYVGEIDSVAYEFKEKRVAAYLRPQVIEFVNCRRASVRDVTVANAASWVQSYDRCVDLLIDGIRVESDTYWNNDGMDILDCRNVRITNCYINASDDGICLKSIAPYFGKEGVSDSILITNCTVRSSASAIKLGTWSYGSFRNIEIRDIKVFDTFRSAIAIEMVDGGSIDGVQVENIKAVNTGNAIFIRLGDREKNREPGSLKNVVLRNLKVHVPAGPPDTEYEIRGPALPFFHNTFPASITGIPGHPVQNITLENIEITYPGGGNPAYANLPLWRLDDVPEQIGLYPEFSMFGELPAWGFYIRHVSGIVLRNVKVRSKKPDYRPAIIYDDVEDLSLEGVEIPGGDLPANGGSPLGQ
ncbi:MAG: glycoside hydrolase family 28 protein [Bacteroidota bacterium]